MKTRKCRTCAKTLPINSFATYVDKRVNKEYIKTDCRECHKQICSKRHYKERYGITLEEYDQMLEEQEGKCAICKSTDTKSAGRMVVDHNHSTGEVRALLCQCCNAMLGQAQDSIHILAAGIQYLNTYGSYGVSDETNNITGVGGDTTIIGGDDDVMDGEYTDVE